MPCWAFIRRCCRADMARRSRPKATTRPSPPACTPQYRTGTLRPSGARWFTCRHRGSAWAAASCIRAAILGRLSGATVASMGWPTQPALSGKSSINWPLWNAVSRITPAPSSTSVMSDAAPMSIAADAASRSPSEVCGDTKVFTSAEIPQCTDTSPLRRCRTPAACRMSGGRYGRGGLAASCAVWGDAINRAPGCLRPAPAPARPPAARRSPCRPRQAARPAGDCRRRGDRRPSRQDLG